MAPILRCPLSPELLRLRAGHKVGDIPDPRGLVRPYVQVAAQNLAVRRDDLTRRALPGLVQHRLRIAGHGFSGRRFDPNNGRPTAPAC